MTKMRRPAIINVSNAEPKSKWPKI